MSDFTVNWVELEKQNLAEAARVWREAECLAFANVVRDLCDGMRPRIQAGYRVSATALKAAIDVAFEKTRENYKQNEIERRP